MNGNKEFGNDKKDYRDLSEKEEILRHLWRGAERLAGIRRIFGQRKN